MLYTWELGTGLPLTILQYQSPNTPLGKVFIVLRGSRKLCELVSPVSYPQLRMLCRVSECLIEIWVPSGLSVCFHLCALTTASCCWCSLKTHPHHYWIDIILPPVHVHSASLHGSSHRLEDWIHLWASLSNWITAQSTQTLHLWKRQESGYHCASSGRNMHLLSWRKKLKKKKQMAL